MKKLKKTSGNSSGGLGAALGLGSAPWDSGAALGDQESSPRHLKASQKSPRASQRRQREPKVAPREAKGAPQTPKGSQRDKNIHHIHIKIIANPQNACSVTQHALNQQALLSRSTDLSSKDTHFSRRFSLQSICF